MNTIQEQLNQLLTIEQVAKKIKRSTRTIERWIQFGKLPAIHIKNNILIDPIDIPSFIRLKVKSKK